MSMLDAFFSKGAFKATRCKTLLKLTIPRIKLLRNRRELQIRQMRKDIANLLQTGQEATARIRVEHIIREENMMAAQEIIELFCELITVRLPIIETQRDCPLDLKEAISSICFAALRCSDLPELQQVQMLFAAKYGREFVAAASELMPDSGVNRQIIELLSVRAPSVEVKMKLLKGIAQEHELDWDPEATETEFLKPHEDLLNGPSHFISGSTLPLPKEKHDESLSSFPIKSTNEEPELESDTGLDSFDLPEVPKVSVRSGTTFPPAPSAGIPGSLSAPEMPPTLSASLPPDLILDYETAKSISTVDTSNEPDVVVIPPSIASTAASPSFTVDAKETKQYVPFVSPPPLAPTPSPSTVRSEEPILSFAEPSPFFSRTKSGANVDLDDVLAAAQTAAESAERAAAAARAAASLAQVRITELGMRRNGQPSEKSENENQRHRTNQSDAEKQMLDQRLSFEKATAIPPRESPQSNCESPGPLDHKSTLQPSRSTSLEDDPYFSYPNLFGRQDSNIGSTVRTSSEGPHN